MHTWDQRFSGFIDVVVVIWKKIKISGWKSLERLADQVLFSRKSSFLISCDTFTFFPITIELLQRVVNILATLSTEPDLLITLKLLLLRLCATLLLDVNECYIAYVTVNGWFTDFSYDDLLWYFERVLAHVGRHS